MSSMMTMEAWLAELEEEMDPISSLINNPCQLSETMEASFDELAAFNKMTTDNQNFFHTFRLAKKGILQDILWVDARSRAAYLEFGDVVSFDSTYLKNKYHLPFANFDGVNHHGQSILLGCALLSRENSETFEWVFNSWLHCMSGKAPTAILTDQNPAMRKALKITMPNTCNRWCIRHILSKFYKYLGKLENYDELKKDLENIIYDSLDREEFEANWDRILNLHKLRENTWLLGVAFHTSSPYIHAYFMTNVFAMLGSGCFCHRANLHLLIYFYFFSTAGLYEESHMWVPAFLKHLFWAGMRTTQRSESINNFFDGYIGKNTPLYEFAENYCHGMEIRSNAEKNADANSCRFQRQLVTDFLAESVFQKCYTDAKFMEVQRECSRVIYLHCLQQVRVSETTT